MTAPSLLAQTQIPGFVNGTEEGASKVNDIDDFDYDLRVALLEGVGKGLSSTLVPRPNGAMYNENSLRRVREGGSSSLKRGAREERSDELDLCSGDGELVDAFPASHLPHREHITTNLDDK